MSCDHLEINTILQLVSVKNVPKTLNCSFPVPTVSHSFQNVFQGNTELKSADNEHVAQLCAKLLPITDKISVH